MTGSRVCPQCASSALLRPQKELDAYKEQASRAKEDLTKQAGECDASVLEEMQASLAEARAQVPHQPQWPCRYRHWRSHSISCFLKCLIFFGNPAVQSEKERAAHDRTKKTAVARFAEAKVSPWYFI